MTPTVDMLLNKLPPYQDNWALITPEQSVRDIIAEMLAAHKEFAPYYDKIALYFDGDNIDDITAGIYDFLKNNIRYKEESEDEQTTAVPTGLLTRGYGDCKHYSSMAGGILDALTRLTGKKINWCYRFASYDPIKTTPHHVYVVVKDNDEEIWIDPTPGANVLEPSWLIDKKVKADAMALHRNISGVPSDHQLLLAAVRKNDAIGKASLTLTPRTNVNPLNWNYSNHYPGVFNPYLGLSQYRDEGGDRNLNSADMANQLNALIAAGPSPGHTVDPEFVTWVYETNLRSWNFYYPGGVKPGFTAATLLPADYPKLVITEDGRLTFDRDVKIDDYKNPEIHLLTAWAQSLINQYDGTPYPIKPQHLKEFSQLLYGNVDTRDLFKERRGSSIFKEVGKGLEDAFNFVKRGVITIVGFAPRNAFLGLVGINGFGFASKLWENIQQGHWEEIANKWKGIGGNPDKLYNTIEDGKDKNAILGYVEDYGNVIGVEPATSTASLLALAAPIIAVLLKFLDKDGKAGEVLSATKSFLQTAYPELDLDAFGFLDKQTGQYLQFDTTAQWDENLGAQNNGTLQPSGSNPLQWASKNPLPVAVGAGAITYFLTNKKGRKANYVLPLLVAGGIYFVVKSMGSSSGTSSLQEKKSALINLINRGGDSEASKQQWQVLVNQTFTNSEIDDIYSFMITYGMNADSLPADLKNRIIAIGSKYNIFT